MDLVTVTRKHDAFNIRVRGHDVTSDLSAKEGGRDAGPSPVEPKEATTEPFSS